jgi:hypothetical protein
MIKTEKDECADAKRDIERWEKELAQAQQKGDLALADKIRGWILERKKKR